MDTLDTRHALGAPVASPQARALAALVGELIPRLACELRPDVLAALERAQTGETSERGRAVLAQLVENARIAAADRVPLCQDTGTVWVLLEVGGDCLVPADLFTKLNEAVATAYATARLRMSVVRDATVDRQNTGDNTPAFCELALVPELGRKARLHVMLKGGGSDNASRLAMLPPSAGLARVRQLVVEAVAEKGANACPPLVIGVGIGATFDKVAALSKRALLREVGSPNPIPELDIFEREALAAVNATDVGPGGFGGATTALAVQVISAPCHIAALPVAVNIGCGALRSASLEFNFEGLSEGEVPAGLLASAPPAGAPPTGVPAKELSAGALSRGEPVSSGEPSPGSGQAEGEVPT